MDAAFGIAGDSAYLPKTTTAQFGLGPLSTAFGSILAQLDGDAAKRAGMTLFQVFVQRRLLEPIGAQHTYIDSAFQALSTVDDLYRLELVLENPADLGPTGRPIRVAEGWAVDDLHGVKRLTLISKTGVMRGAFVRVPSEGITIILLSDRIDDPGRVTDEVLRRMIPVPVPDR